MRENIPVLLLKDLMLLPYQEVRLELNNELSKLVVDLSQKKYNNKILVVCPTNNVEVSPNETDLPKIGVLASIKANVLLPNGNTRLILNGLNRVKVLNYSNIDDVLIANIKRIYINDIVDEEKEQIHIKTLKKLIENYMELNPNASNSLKNSISKIDDLDKLVDVIVDFLPLDKNKKIKYINEFDHIVRATDLIKDLNLEIESINLSNKIDENIHESFEKEQKDYIIKEKIRKLEEELGVTNNKKSILADLEERINNSLINNSIKNRLLEELRKLSYMPETNPDYSVIRNYIENVLSLPWNKYTNEITDLKKIKKHLDKTHYGMEDVKKRIMEFVAIKKLNPDIKAPIICLVGPPGTGKTTLGMSIAESLNREFYKISVGGMNDTSELTGHKRTYLGSSPGKIIQGLKKCNSANPLFLIDEVDKMVKDYKGDPASVLLDILDRNQNEAFIDNYIEEPFNLSKILFILTANDIRAIPDALRDRLEVIDISSYTQLEKIDIAKKYLLPSTLAEYNFRKIKFNDDVLMNIIVNYTNEAGVRDLDRLIKKIIRYIIINELDTKSVTNEMVKEIFGEVKYGLTKRDKSYVGATNVLAVYRNGGAIISVESIFVDGSGKMISSGNLDDSVKESLNLAFSYLKGNASLFKIDMKKMDKKDICFNMLNYGIKKSGSSGGLGMTASLLSLFLNKEIDSSIAFTGEMSLHGDILCVGGIKEKIIGAYNHGIKLVYIPKSNENDLALIPDYVKSKVEIKCIANFITVYEDLLK